MYITTTMCDGVLHCLVFNVFLVSLHGDKCKCTVQRWVSPRHYTVDPMLSASGNLFKGHEEVLYLQPLIPPKRFDIFFPITGGCSEGLGAF